jgi:FSR family fosmidomycin resistance protein-like MFS transporter
VTTASEAENPHVHDTVFLVLVTLSVCHMLNDMMQSLIPSLYPMLKQSHGLTFGQIGLITLAFQLTASILQPLVGIYTDRRAQPYSLAIGMGSSVAGLALLSVAQSFGLILVAAALVGFGSAVFHPESSRMARLASGGRHGLAQSLFQVGGNAGSAAGPLLAAFIVLPRGQGSVAWFTALGMIALFLLVAAGNWFIAHGRQRHASAAAAARRVPGISRGRIAATLAVLLALMFSKFVYTASLSSYYTFYLISTFGVSVRDAQIYLFVYLAAFAAGTFLGGPIGDRFGRKYVIWGSILGAAPFTLALPYANLFWSVVLTIPIGLILSSCFSAIVVYAQELLPGRVGMIAGLFFGFAFGLGGLGAAVLGEVADWTSIGFVYQVCSYLPLIGLVTWFLPDLESAAKRRTPAVSALSAK